MSTQNAAFAKAENRKKIVQQFGATPTDTGKTEVQIALLNQRIGELTLHLGTHKKDYSSMRGMMKLIGQRRSLLKYLQLNHQVRYEAVVKELNLRK